MVMSKTKSPDLRLDLNADLGEGYGAWTLGDDFTLLRALSSANIACGYHAGDADIMARAVAVAREVGADIGAHIGLPDLIGFGRRPMSIDGESFANHVLYQLGALHAIAVSKGGAVTHVSFHGALGDMASRDQELADALVGAVAAFDRSLIVSTSPDTMIMRAARRLGLRSVGIFSADRGYARGGGLVPRKHPKALIKDPAEVARRVVELMRDGSVETVEGERIPCPARTVMIHSDTHNAVAIALAVRAAIEQAGGCVTPLSRLAQDGI
jgi:UPF0271 protein